MVQRYQLAELHDAHPTGTWFTLLYGKTDSPRRWLASRCPAPWPATRPRPGTTTRRWLEKVGPR